MKRIGTVTFHNANNYGAVLQAYALKRYICNMGYNCDVLDYRSLTIEARYHKKVASGGFVKKVRVAIQNAVDQRRYSRFASFRKEYIEPYVYSNEELSSFDTVIVGSDQVWNLNLTQNDTGYFLDFVPGNKISYAASFGVSTLTETQSDFCRQYLQEFSNIAVREPQGLELVYRITGQKADVVVDPVFLLTKGDWIEHLQLRKREKKYILVYLFGYTDDSRKFIRQLKLKTGLDVYVIDGNICPAVYGDKFFRTLNPVRWVELIMNAEYVITNSFHCSAFSIIFERKFFEMPAANGMKTGSRITNLLEISGLSHQAVDYHLPAEMNEDVDWDEVRVKMTPYIEKSKQFLRNVL